MVREKKRCGNRHLKEMKMMTRREKKRCVSYVRDCSSVEESKISLTLKMRMNKV